MCSVVIETLSMLSVEQNGVLRVPLSQSASESKSSLKAEKSRGNF